MAARSNIVRTSLVLTRRAMRRARCGLGAVVGRPALRERAAAVTVFAFIFAFLVGSVDFLITGGGPDWTPGAAEAAQIAQPRLAAPYARPVETESSASLALSTAQFDEPDYSIATEPLLGGPEYLTAYEADRARLYRQINATYERPQEAGNAPEKSANAAEADLEHLYFGAASEPSSRKN